jgi:hypothetical protein
MRNGEMIVNDDLWKGADCSAILIWHLLAKTEERHEESLIRTVSFS